MDRVSLLKQIVEKVRVQGSQIKLTEEERDLVKWMMRESKFAEALLNETLQPVERDELLDLLTT